MTTTFGELFIPISYVELTLSKKRISDFNIVVTSEKDVRRFEEFIESHIGNIVNLDVTFCNLEGKDKDRHYWSVDIFTYSESAYIETINDKQCYDEHLKEKYLIPSISCDGNSYELDIIYWLKMFECPIPDLVRHGGHNVNGFYFIKKLGLAQGRFRYKLERVDEKQLKLKEY